MCFSYRLRTIHIARCRQLLIYIKLLLIILPILIIYWISNDKSLIRFLILSTILIWWIYSKCLHQFSCYLRNNIHINILSLSYTTCTLWQSLNHTLYETMKNKDRIIEIFIYLILIENQNGSYICLSDISLHAFAKIKVNIYNIIVTSKCVYL